MWVEIKFEALCKRSSLGINFQYTARNTPQKNAIVERMFGTLWGMIHAMLNASGMHRTKTLQKLLWAECDNMSTKEHNSI